MTRWIGKSQRIPKHIRIAIERLRIGQGGNDRIWLDKVVDIRRNLDFQQDKKKNC